MNEKLRLPNFKIIANQLRWRWQGKTRGAIGFSLIFCFFCIKAKEKAKNTSSVSARFCSFLGNGKRKATKHFYGSFVFSGPNKLGSSSIIPIKIISYFLQNFSLNFEKRLNGIGIRYGYSILAYHRKK